jgi:hypothetical protein
MPRCDSILFGRGWWAASRAREALRTLSTWGGFWSGGIRARVTGLWSERPAISAVHPSLWRTQKLAAGAALLELGVPHLPRTLDASLRSFDLRFALIEFSKRLGTSWTALVEPRRPEHRNSCERFRAAVSLLSRAEELETDGVTSTPVLTALRGPLSRARTLVEHGSRLATLARMAKTTDIEFPIFQEFLSEFITRLGRWETLPPEYLTEVDELIRGFNALRDVYETTVAELRESLGDLLREPSLPRELRQVCERMSSEVERLAIGVSKGALRPDDGVSRLGELLEKVRVIETSVHPEESIPSPSVDEMSRATCCARLGLDASATMREIKAAYRKVVKRCHPDVAGDDASSIAEFREATGAFKWLEAYERDTG